MLILLILGVLLGAVSVVFALQNISTITVAFLFWHIEGSLSVVLLLAIVAGMLVSALVSVPEVFRDQMKIRALYKRVKELEGGSAQNLQ
ncbi:MAG: LapA family protein [Patescibacteria group bacterium]